jgi:ABC-type phosphate/phosphonate transport system substrate-binding protein
MALKTAIAALTATLLVLLPSTGGNAASQSRPIQIGMSHTFLVDKPKSYVDIATNDFKEVLKKTADLDGVIDARDSAFEIADKLGKKQLEFGILYAHEFAWVQKKHPELQPLLIANHKRLTDRAYIVVHQKGKAKSSADLRGSILDLPMGASETSRLFIEKVCRETAKERPAEFFSSIKKSSSPSDALDEVARGKAYAAVVDTFALEFYKEVKGPVFAKNLRVLQESESFPPAVIIYRKDGVAEATRKQFVDGLRKADTIALGRDLMKAWNMDEFEPIPKDFDKRLAAVLKAYPAPSGK